jgi:hypothetical protein
MREWYTSRRGDDDRVVKGELDVYDKTLQPVVTLALACPGKATMRIWPH